MRNVSDCEMGRALLAEVGMGLLVRLVRSVASGWFHHQGNGHKASAVTNTSPCPAPTSISQRIRIFEVWKFPAHLESTHSLLFTIS